MVLISAAALLLLFVQAFAQQNVFQRQRNAIQDRFVFPGNDRQRFQFNGFRKQSRPFRTRSTSTTTTTTTTTTTKSSNTGSLLEPPIVEKCAKRPKHWNFNGHWYFYSADVPEFQEQDSKTGETVGKKYNWLEARNLCRRHCMDSIGLESSPEWEMIRNNISNRDILYIWSSGRLCDFKGCESREDLKPLNIKGWFWSNSNVKMSPTNQKPPGWIEQPWSYTGHKKQPQPDNAEFDINQTSEPCLGLLNNIYQDGVKWHDIACYHRKPVICEDSEVLLRYARQISEAQNLNINII